MKETNCKDVEYLKFVFVMDVTSLNDYSFITEIQIQKLNLLIFLTSISVFPVTFSWIEVLAVSHIGCFGRWNSQTLILKGLKIFVW